MKYPAQKFADDTGISEKLATRLLEALYAKDLSAEDMNAMIWRLRDWFIQNEMPALIEKLNDDQINAVIDQMIAERAMWAARCPSDVCCAEDEDALTAAFNSSNRPESAWLFTSLVFKDKEFKEGDVVTIQIMRVGTWDHPAYGEVKIDKQVIKDVVSNFANRERGIDLCVDENHEDNHKALGWFREVYSEDGDEKCFAKIELTKKGAELLNEGAYKYFSPEIVFFKIDEESGKEQKNLLIGGAFTNRPFFKAMQPLMASEGRMTAAKTKDPQGQFLFVSNPKRMNKFLELLGKFADAKNVSKNDVEELKNAYAEVAKEHHSKAFDDAVAEVAQKAEGDGAGGDAGGSDNGAAADAADAGAAADANAGGDAAPAGDAAAADTAATDGVKANEDGSFTMSAEAFAEWQKEKKAKRFNDTVGKLAPYLFSDKNKKGFILPKDKQAFAEMLCAFSEKDAQKIVGFLAKFRTPDLSEKGSSKADTADQFSDADKAKDEVKLDASDPMVQEYMGKKFNQPLETAIQSAKNFYKIKAKQGRK